MAVNAFARGLDHPRWLYVLPNGDVLVAETNAPKRPDDAKGIKGWFFKRYQKKAGGAVPSANRITLLRDKDGDGVANTMVGTQIGSYTGTLTGISGTDPTQTINYVRVGSLVTLNIPNAGSGFSGTSDSTSMTITGMPVAIRPSAARVCPFPAVGDNGNLIGDGEAVWAEVGTGGTITFYINGSSTGFTASGTKGTSAGGCISYII
jgi:hypothetical protein